MKEFVQLQYYCLHTGVVTDLSNTSNYCDQTLEEPDLYAKVGDYYSIYYDDYQVIDATKYNDNDREFGWVLLSYEDTLYNPDNASSPTTSMYRKCPDETETYAVRPLHDTKAKIMYTMTKGDTTAYTGGDSITLITGQDLLWYNQDYYNVLTWAGAASNMAVSAAALVTLAYTF